METTVIEKPRIRFEEAPRGAYEAMYNTEKYLRSSGIPHDLYLMIKIRASQINHCGYCVDMHHKEAIKAGERFEKLYMLNAWKEAPHYTEHEKAVLNLTETLTYISKANPEDIEHAYEKMAQFYSKEEIVNIVLAICQINAWNRIVITFGNVPGTYKVS